MNEIFSDPIFYNNDSIWNFLSGKSGNFNYVTSLLVFLSEAIVLYFIVVSSLLLYFKRLDWKIHLAVFILFLALGDILPATQVFGFIGGILNNDRISTMNAETFRHILAFGITLGLITLSFMKTKRSISRVVFAGSGTIIFATTFVFHIVYFHTLQAVGLYSHTNHAQMITLLDEKDFTSYCELSNLKCYSGEQREEISKIEDVWIRNYLVDRLRKIESFTTYDVRDINLEIMKTNIVGGGARTGYFRKNDFGWRVAINEDSVKSFARSLELAFWVQMVIAHYVWVTLSLFVIFAHEKRVFRRNHIKTQ